MKQSLMKREDKRNSKKAKFESLCNQQQQEIQTTITLLDKLEGYQKQSEQSESKMNLMFDKMLKFMAMNLIVKNPLIMNNPTVMNFLSDVSLPSLPTTQVDFLPSPSQDPHPNNENNNWK